MQHRELEIALKGHNVMLTGFPDTGNHLQYLLSDSQITK